MLVLPNIDICLAGWLDNLFHIAGVVADLLLNVFLYSQRPMHFTEVFDLPTQYFSQSKLPSPKVGCPGTNSISSEVHYFNSDFQCKYLLVPKKFKFSRPKPLISPSNQKIQILLYKKISFPKQ